MKLMPRKPNCPAFGPGQAVVRTAAFRVTVLVAAAALLAAFVLGVAACGSSGANAETTAASTSATAAAKLPKLTLVASPGPMAIPLEYMVANNKLANVADKTELLIWENADQLKAMVAGGQGDFVTVPSNNSATFYNKGVKIELLDISVWNITYLVTRDPTATGFPDIKGESLVVPFQGSVPDVMFQYIAKKEGLDPEEDFQLQYVTDPTMAAQLLLAGKADNAVLSEALATAVLLQTKDADKPLRKALAFDKAWAAVAGDDAASPIAGTVATASVLDKPAVIAAFSREYQAAVEWMLANPEAAGKLVETQLPQLGLKAAVMAASLKSISWKYTPVAQARPALDAFYGVLSELSPDVIGGKLPDDGFYYTP
jgi:NitT/TauT family transport system substrate-binding protein